MSRLKHPPAWLVTCGYVLVLLLTSWIIIRFGLTDSLLLIFMIPCVLAALFYRRSVYWIMSFTLVVVSTWTTRKTSSNYAASLNTIILASASALIMAELMRALTVARTQAQVTLNRQTEESQRLSEMGIALLDCDKAEQVFAQLGAALTQVAPNTVIVINETTPDRQHLVTRQLLGMEGTLFEQAEKLFGFKIVGRSAPIAQKLQERFYQLRLLHLTGGLCALLDDAVPQTVGKIAENLFSLHDVYTIGIVGHGTLWGNVALITRRPGIKLPSHLIESMVYQSFLALSRIAITQQLTINEQKYRLLFQNLSTGFALLEVVRDAKGLPADYRVLETNSALWKIFQIPAENVLGHTANSLLPPTESTWLERFDGVMLTGAPVHFETFSPATQRWFEISAYSPEAERLAVMISDITDHKQAEEALQQSEERYRTIFDQSVEGIYMHDLDGAVLDVNHIACLQSGYSREELLKMNIFDLHPALPTSPRDVILQQWQEWHPGERFTIEAEHQRKNGEIFPVEISTGVIEYAKRKLVLSIVRDIAERRQNEAALTRYREQLEELVALRTAEMQEQYAQLNAILRSVGDAIFMTDAEQRIRYVNPSLTTLTGYQAADLLEQDLHTLDVLMDITPRLQPLAPPLLQGKPWQGEVRIQRKDGRFYDAALTAAPVLDDTGQITGHVFTHRDISQAKDLERARSQFIANVSHQFRTPLTALKTNLHILQSTNPAEHQQRQLNSMATSINWLTQLVQDTLEISALDSGRGVESWAPVSLPDIITGVLEGYQKRALNAGVNMEAVPFPTLPPMRGDARRLAQAISELVENAIVFTPASGQVTIKLQTENKEGDTWIALSVKDTGPGIPAEEVPRLFERFFRGQLNEAGHTAGAGLGLSIAHKIIEAHGGHISVESTVGKGSTFTLWLRPDSRGGSYP
ncbi:MAG: PAS domain S-box protein [Anaerolineae bacterium]|nr:PAS domain S-box protein [Anaerolineae bacterium]